MEEFAIHAAVNGFCHGSRLVGQESMREGGEKYTKRLSRFVA